MPDIIKSQKDLRRDRNVKDQFGRLWLAALEQTKDGWEPTEVIAAGWDDPLRTPRRFLKSVIGEFGERDPARIRVDVKAWRDDTFAAERDWTVEFYQRGRDHYKNAFNARDPAVFTDEFLLSLVGPKPFPSVAALDQAFGLKNGQQPDPALLGQAPLTAAHRVLLGKPLPDDLAGPAPDTTDHGPEATYADFVKEYGIREAPAKWAEHKAALQEA